MVVPEPEVAADAEVRYDVNNRAKPEMAAEAEVHTENNCQTPPTSGKSLASADDGFCLVRGKDKDSMKQRE